MGAAKKSRVSNALDAYEQDIEDHVGSAKPLPLAKKVRYMAKLQLAAQKHLEEKKVETSVNVKLFVTDLVRLKKIAKKEGVSCQYLVARILHQFSEGLLVSKK